MKKYFSILCMLMLALSFNACSSSDDNDNSDFLVGEWSGYYATNDGRAALCKIQRQRQGDR